MYQFRTRCRLKDNKEDGEILSFSFNLGPIRVVCIANIPGDGREDAPVYVKVGFDPAFLGEGWTRDEVKR